MPSERPDFKILEQTADHQFKILGLLDKTIKKLQAIGLTREAAIKNAGKAFHLDISDADIAPVRAQRARTGRRAKRGRPKTKK